jgi:protein-disulfide isomerase
MGTMAKVEEESSVKSLIEKIVPILLVLSIALAFVVGILWNKVSTLEKGTTLGANTAANGAAAANPSAPPSVNIDSAGGVGHFPIMGSSSAKVTLIEFADFRCPYCEQFFSQTEPQIIQNYVNTGKVKFAFRNYAFLGPASVVAADASECANDQGKFWAFHDYLYKNQPDESDTSMYNSDTLTKDAVSLGMDGTKFNTCLSTKADDAKVQQDLADGEKAGVSGTPAFFVNGTFINGAEPYSVFQQAIDAALK